MKDLKEDSLAQELNIVSKCFSQLKTLQFNAALEELKNLKSLYQSRGQLLDTCNCLTNISSLHFYLGEMSQSYHYAEEALNLFENFVKKNKAACHFLYEKIIYVRTLINFAWINIFMGLCDSSIEIFEKVNNLISNSDNDSKEYLSNYILEQFFVFFVDMNKNVEYYGSDIFIFLKTFNYLFSGFEKYLKNNNSEYFLKCMKESINNLGILGNQEKLISVPMINMSLQNIIKDEKKISKEIFKDFLILFNLQLTGEEIENFYFKIINEHYQKFETAKIIYDSFENTRTQIMNSNKIYPNIESLMQLLSNKLKNELTNEENRNDLYLFSNSIIYSQTIYNHQKLEIFSNKLIKYIQNLFNNIFIIYKKSKLKLSFTKLMKRTLTFMNIKDYRKYKKKTIIDPKIKKYHYTCLDSFELRGFPVTKFNFSSIGKKEKYIKFGKEESVILFSSSSKFSKISKKIKLQEISHVVYGISTKNLKSKYSEFQKETYKKPWQFLSIIIDNIKNSSIDLFFENENDLKQTLYSFNLIKYVYGLENIKVYKNTNFIFKKIKLKMIHKVKEHYRTKWLVDNSLKELEIETCWSFTKIFLYMIKNKLKI
jgi:hypothetical protein